MFDVSLPFLSYLEACIAHGVSGQLFVLKSITTGCAMQIKVNNQKAKGSWALRTWMQFKFNTFLLNVWLLKWLTVSLAMWALFTVCPVYEFFEQFRLRFHWNTLKMQLQYLRYIFFKCGVREDIPRNHNTKGSHC